MQPTEDSRRTSISVNAVVYDRLRKMQRELSFKLDRVVTLQEILNASLNVALDNSAQLQKELAQ
jgi:hypothetical protein